MKVKIQKLRDQGLTYQAIGNKVGLSRQRVHQILFSDKFKAYHKAYLKAYRKTDKFKAYLKAYRKRTFVSIHKLREAGLIK